MTAPKANQPIDQSIYHLLTQSNQTPFVPSSGLCVLLFVCKVSEEMSSSTRSSSGGGSGNLFQAYHTNNNSPPNHPSSTHGSTYNGTILVCTSCITLESVSREKWRRRKRDARNLNNANNPHENPPDIIWYLLSFSELASKLTSESTSKSFQSSRGLESGDKWLRNKLVNVTSGSTGCSISMSLIEQNALSSFLACKINSLVGCKVPRGN